MNAIASKSPTNKTAARWERENRREQKNGILDTGATSGAAPEEDKEAFKKTGMNSNKTFMFPDKRTRSATKKMHLKHKLRETAKEVNIVPGLHSTLISVPKLADADYTTVFEKDKATIYDATTTSISTTLPPVLEAHQCKLTGLWKLNLEPDKDETTKANDTHQPKNPSTSYSTYPAPAKAYSGTMQQQASQQKKLS
jgi:hypothetical protein